MTTSHRRSRTLLAVLSVVLFGAACQASPATAPPPAPVASAPAADARQAPAPAPAAADRYDLGRDETRGGHTLARHVGRSDADLSERLRREPQISAASTYTDRVTAERVVALTLARNRARIDQWLGRRGSRPNLALDYVGDPRDPIGRSLSRRTARPIPCSNAVVVLRWDGQRGFIVLTSYPEATR